MGKFLSNMDSEDKAVTIMVCAFFFMVMVTLCVVAIFAPDKL